MESKGRFYNKMCWVVGLFGNCLFSLFSNRLFNFHSVVKMEIIMTPSQDYWIIKQDNVHKVLGIVFGSINFFLFSTARSPSWSFGIFVAKS